MILKYLYLYIIILNFLGGLLLWGILKLCDEITQLLVYDKSFLL